MRHYKQYFRGHYFFAIYVFDGAFYDEEFEDTCDNLYELSEYTGKSYDYLSWWMNRRKNKRRMYFNLRFNGAAHRVFIIDMEEPNDEEQFV